MGLKGDEVDEIFEEYLRGVPLRFPIQRLGEGYYLFGLRKIFVKILSGQLVVRVNTGFITFQEFMDSYYEREAQAVEDKALDEGLSVEDVVRQAALQ